MLLSVSAGCTAPPDPAPGGAGPASHLFVGGEIVTLDPGRPRAQALAIGDGVVLAVGTREEVESLRGPATEVVDLAGGVVVPALTDHHVHLLNVGLALRWAEEPPLNRVDLAGAGSLEEIARRVRERAAELPPGSWILGQGWSQAAWGTQALPGHGPLTEAAPDHPVYLTRVDGHAGWLNGAAMARAGIDASTSDPPGGAIRRDAAGAPTGVLLERANEPLLRLLPEPDDEEVAAAFRAAAEALAAQGVTEVFDAGFLAPAGIVDMGLDLDRYLEVLLRADRERPLPLRVNLMVPAPSGLAERLAVPAAAAERQLSPRVRLTHLKLFADGALGSRGADLDRPSADDPATRGVERMDRGELRREAERALDAGLDVATHAIGDRAIRQALDVYAGLLAARPDLDPGRLRIEHFSFPREEDQRRAAELGVVLSVQPNFVYPDDDGVTMEDHRLGAAETTNVYAWRRAAELGARLALGSDYFTAPLPPLTTYFCAVTRRNLDGRPPDGWHPGERLPRLQALELVATTCPPGGGALHQRRLAAGEPADLTVLSADPLTGAEEELPAIEVRATYLAGQPTFAPE